MRYWLLKTEPDSFSIRDLAASPGQATCWDGVRNYQARNFMRDDMQVGDRVLVYHSSVDPPGVAGTAIVVRPGYPDHTAQDPEDHHYDPKATVENPIWTMVDIRWERTFPELIPLDELRNIDALSDMELLRRGSRLSVQPVEKAEFEAILKLATSKPDKQAAAKKAADKKPAAKKASAKRPAATKNPPRK